MMMILIIEIMNLIKDSVNMRMGADVGIANFLSGGIDSTSLIKIISTGIAGTKT